MFGSINNLLASLRDKSVETSAIAFLNQKLAGFGEVKRLEIDSAVRAARIELELKGEPNTIWISVDSFEILQAQGKAWIIARKVAASREWIGAALERYVVGRKFELPPGATWLLG